MLELFLLVLPHQGLPVETQYLIQQDGYDYVFEADVKAMTPDQFIEQEYGMTVHEFLIWNTDYNNSVAGYIADWETIYNQYYNVNIPLLDERIEIPHDAVFLVGQSEGVFVIPENCQWNPDECHVYPNTLFGIN